MKAVGYVRVSTESQEEEGTSLDDQKDIITRKAEVDQHELVDIYQDVVSGGSVDRTKLQQLIKDAHLKKFDIIYFTKLDRFARSVRDTANLYFELNEQLGIELICIEQPELNTKNPFSKALLSLIAVFAEFERNMIRQRMSKGMKIKWRNGETFIGDTPFGYRKEKPKSGVILVDDETANVYKRIASMYLDERLSAKKIALQLTREAIPTPSASKITKDGKGKKGRKGIISTTWDSKTILGMLKNSAYKGQATYCTHERESVNGGHRGKYLMVTKKLKDASENIIVNYPALITEERWQQIQQRIEQQKKLNRHERKGFEFLLNGMMYCGECGAKMKPRTKVEKSGKVKKYYRCFWRGVGHLQRELSGREMCKMKAQDTGVIEERVYDKIIHVLSNLNQYAASWLKDLDADAIEQEIRRLNDKQENLMSQLESDFVYLRSVTNPEMRERLQSKHKQLQDEYEQPGNT